MQVLLVNEVLYFYWLKGQAIIIWVKYSISTIRLNDKFIKFNYYNIVDWRDHFEIWVKRFIKTIYRNILVNDNWFKFDFKGVHPNILFYLVCLK